MNHLLYNDLTNLVQTQNFASQILRLNRCNALQTAQIISIGANHCEKAQRIAPLQIFKPLNLEPFELYSRCAQRLYIESWTNLEPLICTIASWRDSIFIGAKHCAATIIKSLNF